MFYMELDVKKIDQVSADVPFEEKFFSIENSSMIFDILRSKMYSDPIAAICREISCNARDAHREVGKFDLPIMVQLPKYGDLFFKVKDFGPGISKDRIDNIFLKYTAYTKRNDNVQTGGFGLGAKTPFAYSDSFTIITNVDGIKYNYLCYIDETKIGKLTLISEANTDECNGTEIIVPVKKDHISDFHSKFLDSIKHWQVYPNLYNGEPVARKESSKNSEKIEGNNWVLLNSSGMVSGYSYYHNSYYDTKCYLLIDDIEYKCPNDTLSKLSGGSLPNYNGVLYLKFNIGDLALSATRESVYFNDKTNNAIKEKIKEFSNEIVKIIQEEIDKTNHYWEAVKIKIDKVRSFGFVDKFDLFWKGNKVESVFNYTYMTNYHKYINKNNGETKYSKYYDSPTYDQEPYFVIDDYFDQNVVNNKTIKKIFENHFPNVDRLYVVAPLGNEDPQEKIKKLEDRLKLFKYVLASKYISPPKKRETSSKSRLVLFKFDPKYANNGQFFQSSVNDFEKDTSKKTWCKIDSSRYVKDAICSFSYKMLKNVSNTHSIYAVYDKLDEDRINDLFSVTPYIKDVIDDIIEIDKIDYNRLEIISDNYGNYREIQSTIDIVYPHLKNKNSWLCNLKNKIDSLLLEYKTNKLKYEMYSDLYNNKLSDEQLNEKLKKELNFSTDIIYNKYPLLQSLFYHNKYYGDINKNILNDLTKYIDLIDNSVDDSGIEYFI